MAHKEGLGRKKFAYSFSMRHWTSISKNITKVKWYLKKVPEYNKSEVVPEESAEVGNAV
jgi:hypothetical protein